jgi:glutamine---fructose-6-phosphate transaminase (isomerizing)
MSHMAKEAAEAPAVTARFLEHNRQQLQELGARLRLKPPPVIVTSARGSSDHAAGYFNYLAEILTGVPCCSMGASVASIYEANLRIKDGLCITISQSGQSPDILALQEAAKHAGALTVAIVNDDASPAAQNADICLPLCAGPEQSVAATKSCIAAMVAGASLVAHWLDDLALLVALDRLPQDLEKAARIGWPEATELCVSAESLFVLGRGPVLPIAAETALKLKETCAIHAEAYSIAEVMHGPLELLEAEFPVLVFAPDDKALEPSRKAIEKLRKTKARVLVAGEGGLPYMRAASPWLHPISLLQTAYLSIEATAIALGRNPDRPRQLRKITETI